MYWVEILGLLWLVCLVGYWDAAYEDALWNIHGVPQTSIRGISSVVYSVSQLCRVQSSAVPEILALCLTQPVECLKLLSHVSPCTPATHGLLPRGDALRPRERKRDREREREVFATSQIEFGS